MKYLYLVRHAKSSWTDPRLSDFDRPLNKRGKRDVVFMGKRLATLPYRPEMIVSSPAKRARKTARAIFAEWNFKKKDITLLDKLYTFSAGPIVEVIRGTPDSIKVLAVIGHNYGLTECAEMLGGKAIENVPTCGIVLISFALPTWGQVAPNSGAVLTLDYPKLHQLDI